MSNDLAKAGNPGGWAAGASLLSLGFVAFMCFGVVLVLIGANQAALARDLGLDYEQTGILSSALALGIGIGVIAAGPLFDRAPGRLLFVVPMLAAAASLLSVDASVGFARLALHMLALGISIGAYDTVINASVSALYDEASPRPMALVHSGATLGAMLGPLLVGWVFSDNWLTSFHLIGVSHLFIAVWAIFVRFPAYAAVREEEHSEATPVLSIAMLPLAAVAFAYVGVESTLTVFAVPYAEFLGLDDGEGQISISAFWLGLLIGRFAMIARRSALGAPTLTTAGVLGAALLGGGVAMELPNEELMLGLVGYALGAVYPLMIALVGQTFPHARGTAAGVAAGAGALGGFVAPWLTGWLADVHGIRVGFASMALWCVAIALSATLIRRHKRRGD